MAQASWFQGCTVVECCREAMACQARSLPPPRRGRQRRRGVGLCDVVSVGWRSQSRCTVASVEWRSQRFFGSHGEGGHLVWMASPLSVPTFDPDRDHRSWLQPRLEYRVRASSHSEDMGVVGRTDMAAVMRIHTLFGGSTP